MEMEKDTLEEVVELEGIPTEVVQMTAGFIILVVVQEPLEILVLALEEGTQEEMVEMQRVLLVNVEVFFVQVMQTVTLVVAVELAVVAVALMAVVAVAHLMVQEVVLLLLRITLQVLLVLAVLQKQLLEHSLVPI